MPALLRVHGADQIEADFRNPTDYTFVRRMHRLMAGHSRTGYRTTTLQEGTSICPYGTARDLCGDGDSVMITLRHLARAITSSKRTAPNAMQRRYHVVTIEE